MADYLNKYTVGDGMPPFQDGADLIHLLPGRSDVEVVAEFKKEAEAALLSVCGVLDRANRAGFVISFSIGVIPGRNVLQNLAVAKHY